MFNVFYLSSDTNSRNEWYTFTAPGIDAIRFREKHGLPPGTDSRFPVLADDVNDRRAAESWPEALDSSADLPNVIVPDNCREPRPGESEFGDMLAAGILALAGPEKTGEGYDGLKIRLKLTCSAFELVQWRRAWAAEQRAKEAEAKLAELETARSEGDLNDV